MQQIKGYRLLAEDGTSGDWKFFNEGDILTGVDIRLKNGSYYLYDGYKPIGEWANARRLVVAVCRFSFDPVGMAFTRES